MELTKIGIKRMRRGRAGEELSMRTTLSYTVLLHAQDALRLQWACNNHNLELCAGLVSIFPRWIPPPRTNMDETYPVTQGSSLRDLCSMVTV
eukprot:scaffold183774_cov17-Tisochrysis_lutea.AAC.1